MFVGSTDHDLAAGVDTIRYRRAAVEPVPPANAWLDLLFAPTRR